MTKKTHTIFSLISFVLALTVIESFGQTFIMKNSINSNKYYYIIGSIIYAFVVPFMLSKSFEYEGIATINILWNIMSIIVMTMIGYLLFDETVNHLHLISILLVICAIVLLYFANKKRE